MKANKANSNSLLRMNLNEKTRTIKIDVYNLNNESYHYMYTAICKNVDEKKFDWVYNDQMSCNEIYHLLIRDAKKTLCKGKEL